MAYHPPKETSARIRTIDISTQTDCPDSNIARTPNRPRHVNLFPIFRPKEKASTVCRIQNSMYRRIGNTATTVRRNDNKITNVRGNNQIVPSPAWVLPITHFFKNLKLK